MNSFYMSEILHYQPSELAIEQVKELIRNYLSHVHQIKQSQIRYFNPTGEHFTIEMIRDLHYESQYAVDFMHGGHKRAFVLLNFITAEVAAQNAALKLIEESPPNTLIIIPINDQQRLLPTIISRCKIISLPNSDSKNANSLASNTTEIVTNAATLSTFTAAIELAAQYKDRDRAQNYLLQLIKIPDNKTSRRQQILLKSYQALESNANVSLTLEECFFSLISLKEK